MKYRDYLVLPAIIMYIVFASCAFIAKADNTGKNSEDAVPTASVNPTEISWGCEEDNSGEYWYAAGARTGEFFSVEKNSKGSNEICFYDSKEDMNSSKPVTYLVNDMHMKCLTEEGRHYDLIFLDEMTAYDCISETYYQRADYDTLSSQLVSGKFVNSTNSRDYYVFEKNGKSYEYFGDQVFKGLWTLETSETMSVYDKTCKQDFNFNLMFDNYGNISGFTFNEIAYNLAA